MCALISGIYKIKVNHGDVWSGRYRPERTFNCPHGYRWIQSVCRESSSQWKCSGGRTCVEGFRRTRRARKGSFTSSPVDSLCDIFEKVMITCLAHECADVPANLGDVLVEMLSVSISRRLALGQFHASRSVQS